MLRGVYEITIFHKLSFCHVTESVNLMTTSPNQSILLMITLVVCTLAPSEKCPSFRSHKVVNPSEHCIFPPVNSRWLYTKKKQYIINFLKNKFDVMNPVSKYCPV